MLLLAFAVSDGCVLDLCQEGVSDSYNSSHMQELAGYPIGMLNL